MNTPPPFRSLRSREEASERARAYLERILTEMPSAFSRLTFVSGLRQTDPKTDPVLVEIRPPSLVDSVLRDVHKHLFRRWLTLPLREQVEEVDVHLALLGFTWSSMEPRTFLQFCRDAAPIEASYAELKLFMSSIEALLRVRAKCAE